jgi:glucans biosynthesis protein C
MEQTMNRQAYAPPAGRRFDLDWLRVAAFGLLIFYHVGMVYVPWGFHVKSRSPVPEIEPLMAFLNPWRLSLLFLVSGVATRFMADRLRPATLASRRTTRLLPPLILGILVIVPPQSYVQVAEQAGYAGTFWSFYTSYYFHFGKTFCSPGPCLTLPTWNHLWFVAYLWVYTLALIPILALAPRVLVWVEALFSKAFTGIGVLVFPFVALCAYRILLAPVFPQSDALVDDWYNHAVYFTVFAFGFLFAKHDSTWASLVRWRWGALSGMVAAYAFCSVLRVSGLLDLRPVPHWIVDAGFILYPLYQWCAIAAVLGFGRRWLNHDSPVRRYLTDAVFPYYIVHQTAIVVAEHWLKPLLLPLWMEGALLILVTAGTCALSYEAVRRVRWLRPWFGLKREPVARLHGEPASVG